MTTAISLFSSTLLPSVYYSRAPISEAVLDVFVSLPAAIQVHTLQGVRSGLENEFPVIEERVLLAGGLRFSRDEGSSSSISHKHTGFLFRSAERGEIFQARLDGFSFNKLAPYSSWSEFSTEARRLWKHYAAIVSPTSVDRIALRYINRIEINEPVGNPRDYCVLIPEVVGEAPVGLSEFFSRLTAPVTNPVGAHATLSVVFDPSGSASILLDIEVGIAFSPSLPLPSEGIWPLFDQLRDLKNHLFETSVTAKAKSLFA